MHYKAQRKSLEKLLAISASGHHVWSIAGKGLAAARLRVHVALPPYQRVCPWLRSITWRLRDASGGAGRTGQTAPSRHCPGSDNDPRGGWCPACDSASVDGAVRPNIAATASFIIIGGGVADAITSWVTVMHMPV